MELNFQQNVQQGCVTAEINYNNADSTLHLQKVKKQATPTTKKPSLSFTTSFIIHTLVRPDLGIFRTVQLDYIQHSARIKFGVGQAYIHSAGPLM